MIPWPLIPLCPTILAYILNSSIIMMKMFETNVLIVFFHYAKSNKQIECKALKQMEEN